MRKQIKNLSCTLIAGLSYILFFISINSIVCYSKDFSLSDTTQAFSDIISAANSRKLEFLNKIPNGSESRFNFKNRKDFQETNVGSPYYVYTLNPDCISQDCMNNLNNSLVMTNEYRVPLIFDNKYTDLITVSKTGTIYSAVDFGAGNLAQELQKLEDKFAISPNKVKVIISVFNLGADFWVLNPSEPFQNWKVYPLISADRIIKDKRSDNQIFYWADIYIAIRNLLNK